MSRLDYSQILFGDGIGKGHVYRTSGYGSAGSTGSQSPNRNGARMRYGTAVTDSFETEGGTSVTVILDGSDGQVTIPCDVTVKAGDRVVVFVDGNHIKVAPLEARILDEASKKALEQSQALVDEVNGAFDDFKADHQLTDADITSTFATGTEVESLISGSIEDGGALYEAYSYLKQGVDGIGSTVEEKLSAEGGVYSRLSEIEQDSDKITQRVKAVEDGVGEVESSVTQTATELRAEFGQIDDKYDALIRLSAKGVEVGRTDYPYRAIVNSNGSYDIDYVTGSVNQTLVRIQSDIGSSETSIVSPVNGLVLKSTLSDVVVESRSGSLSFSGTSGLKVSSTGTSSISTSTSSASVLGAHLLFSNNSGTSSGGSVSLRASPSNYSIMDFEFIDSSSRAHTARVVNNRGTAAVAGSRVVFNGGSYVTSVIMTCSSNSTSCQWGLGGGVFIKEASTVITGDSLKLRRVVGWRT